MRSYSLTGLARADVREAVEYLREKTGNTAASRRLLDDLERAFDLLTTSPMIGRPRGEIGPTVRSHVAGRYVIFYSAGPKVVTIARVLHQRRDVRKEFGLDPGDRDEPE